MSGPLLWPSLEPLLATTLLAPHSCYPSITLPSPFLPYRQATFTNVTAVQTAGDTGAANAVAEVDHWPAASYVSQLYDSCKVRYGTRPPPAPAARYSRWGRLPMYYSLAAVLERFVKPTSTSGATDKTQPIC